MELADNMTEATDNLLEAMLSRIARSAAYFQTFEIGSVPFRIGERIICLSYTDEKTRTGYIRLANGKTDAASRGTTDGYSIRLPDAIEAAASGHHVSVNVVARAAGGARSRFALAYSTNDVGNSGWRWQEAGPEWSIFSMEYDVPVMKKGNGDFVGILPDAEGRSGTEFCYLSVKILEATEAPKRAAPAAAAPTVERFRRRLTIGMATFDDYDGAYFTIQSIRLNNPELQGALEFVVIDNNPGGPCSEALNDLGKWVDGYRYVPRGEWSGTAMKNAVFEEASSPFVLCIDSHVLIVPGALSKLISYFEANPESPDLVQGPLIYDDLHNKSTHMEPQWRDGMYGTWANDPRGADPGAPVFEIPMQGMGLFACTRAAWPGFNPKFRGFGGEEGYIHEKIRQRGGRTLCLPFLLWMHRFNRPLGAPYVNRWEDRMRNYVIGFTELGLDTAQMEAHFPELLGAETSARIFAEIKLELKSR